MIAVPDRTTPAVQQAVVAQCELLADRFGVLDAEPGLDPFAPAQLPAQRAGLDSARGYAALYYPWLRVPPVDSGDPVLVPPSGHICGIFARDGSHARRVQGARQRHVNGALGLERVLSDIDQGILNLSGINVLPGIPGRRTTRICGARARRRPIRNWQYVNIRRLFIYLEKSIQEGIRWAVFEPNNLQLWQKLKRAISDFLNQRVARWRAVRRQGRTRRTTCASTRRSIRSPSSSWAGCTSRSACGRAIRRNSSSFASASGPAARTSAKAEQPTRSTTMATSTDPYGNFNFLVEIDGIVRAAFHEVSGLDSTIDMIEHREGGDNTAMRKYPGSGEVLEHHA